MEENGGKDLAQDKKSELLNKIREIQNEKREECQNEHIEVKYYEDCELKLGKSVIGNNILRVSVAEIDENILQPNGEVQNSITYDLYMKYNGQDILIAHINEAGKLQINMEEVERIDPENKLGLLELGEDEKPDLRILKELDGKTEKELEKEKDDRDRSKEETTKDDNEEDKEEEESKEEDEEEKAKQAEQEQKNISRRKGLREKDIFVIRKDSQFFKNYPQIPRTTYFYRDRDGKIKAEYIDKNGRIKPSEFFKDSTTQLKEDVIGLRDDGNPIKQEKPYQVMQTKGLSNTNTKARDVRMAIYIEQGYMEIEETRLGTNGEWTGYGLEARGKDYNSKVVNELSNTRTNKVRPEDISSRYNRAKETGLADDGVQIQDLSPQVIIDRFVDEGYTKREALEIYDYMTGPQKLPEETAKEKVNEEIAKRQENRDREENDGEKTPWDNPRNRRG